MSDGGSGINGGEADGLIINVRCFPHPNQRTATTGKPRTFAVIITPLNSINTGPHDLSPNH